MRLLSFFCLIFIFYSCRNDYYVPEICFEQKVLPILVNKCANQGCHNSSDKAEGYDFTSYEGVMKAVKPNHANASKLWNSIRFGKMPPKSHVQLTKDEKNIIKSWIQFGAKNEGCNSFTCDTTHLSYSKVNSILSTYCLGCHNQNNFSGGWNLDNYEDVKIAASSGYLLGTVEWLPGYSKMPQSSPKIPDCDILKIKKWINDGMPQ